MPNAVSSGAESLSPYAQILKQPATRKNGGMAEIQQGKESAKIHREHRLLPNLSPALNSSAVLPQLVLMLPPLVADASRTSAGPWRVAMG